VPYTVPVPVLSSEAGWLIRGQNALGLRVEYASLQPRRSRSRSRYTTPSEARSGAGIGIGIGIGVGGWTGMGVGSGTGITYRSTSDLLSRPYTAHAMPRERIPETGEAEQRALFGPMDRHLRAVRERYGVRISVRRGVLMLEGDDAGAVRDVTQRVKRVIAQVRGGREPPVDEIEDLLLGANGTGASPVRSKSPSRKPTSRATGTGGDGWAGSAAPRSKVEPRTEGQARYVKAIRTCDAVFAVGPAGTGKTYLAVVEAVAALRAGETRKIVLTRPAVEAGEKLGFLPGDFHAKINPYLRPLYDALGELMPWGEVQRYIDADIIEIVPLAYMRGRTLKGSFIILDEAQNTTPTQMKMFLTRMGDGSKVVVNGDATQVDLPEGHRSGLAESVRILRDVKGIAVIHFGAEDILRHPLVQRIVDAYERVESPLWNPADPKRGALRQDGDAETP